MRPCVAAIEAIAEGKAQKMFGQGSSAVLRHHRTPIVPPVDALEQPEIKAVAGMPITFGPGHRPQRAPHRYLARDEKADQLHGGLRPDDAYGEAMRHPGSDALSTLDGLGHLLPGMMSEHAVHRHDWLNKQLPFCPVSGERLVSRCPRCANTLGWAFTCGPAVCEHCEEPVPPSPEPALRGELVEDYRRFSRLISFDPAIRAQAWSSLPDALHEHSPGAAMGLAVRVQRHLRDRCGTKLRASLHTLDPDEIADIVCGSVTLLDGWPHSIREAIRVKVDQLGDDHGTFVSLWRRLKAISRPHRATGLEQADLLLSALPDIAGPVWRGLAPSYRVYLQQDARMKTGLTARQLEAASAHLSTTLLPSAGKRNIFYKADEIDALRLLCEASMPLTKVASDWILPNYAIEQLAHSDVITHVDEPIIATIHALPRIRRESVVALTEFLFENRSTIEKPACARPLAKTMRMHGGGAKPWAAVFRCLLKGDVEWWIDGAVPNSRTILVRPCDIHEFRPLGTDRAPRLRDSPVVSKKDAAEILNLTPSGFQRLYREQDLLFDRVAKADRTLLKTITDMAERWITTAEINERCLALGRTENWEVRLEGVQKCAAGWDREQAMGLLKLG